MSGADPGAAADAALFPRFRRERLRTRETEIHAVVGGAGPPVLLLHGFPQTHACWHRVAPVLAARFTVVCPDLRGYGDSGRPPADLAHRAYSKRAMAGDQVETMGRLGFERFSVVGHDRGARVAYRLAPTTRSAWRASPSSTSCRRSRPGTGSTGGAPWPTTTGSSSRSRPTCRSA